MKVIKLILLVIFLSCLVFAQEEQISSGQANALKILAERNGFTTELLNEYLNQEYGTTIDGLTKTTGIILIKKFQSANPPHPSEIRRIKPVVEKAPEKPTLATILEEGMSKRFHLIDKSVIEGTIVQIDDDICQIGTADGLLFIPKSDILDETVEISKKDGTRYSGPVLKETPEDITIRSRYGDVVLDKRDIRDFDRYHGGELVPMTEDKRKFFRGEAQLISIMMDPTAFLLESQTFYVSGLSIGYGFTDRFMLTSKFGSGFSGDLNIHPKIRIFHKQTGTMESAASIGFAIHRAYPLKSLAAKYSHTIIDSNDVSINEIDGIVIDDVLNDKNANSMYSEFYFVLSKRRTLESGRGKVGWSVGFKTNTLPLKKPGLNSGYEWDDDAQFKMPFRVWASLEYDLRKNLKFVGSVWADNSNKTQNIEEVFKDYISDGTPFVLDSPGGEYNLFDFDFGFLYAFNENFRIGLHFQQPFLDFYWEFFEF